MSDDPGGATVIVHRRGAGGVELLILRRVSAGPAPHDEPSDVGDWTWTPPEACPRADLWSVPGGSRLPSEPVGLCAQRELLDETGLVLPLRLTGAGSLHWRVFKAEARPDARIVLSDAHDAYAWVVLDEALRRCRPSEMAEQIRAALAA